MKSVQFLSSIANLTASTKEEFKVPSSESATSTSYRTHFAEEPNKMKDLKKFPEFFDEND